jgi:FGGY-family pentulose kinase
MVPGLWLNEGGQSAAGAAIDHLLSFHPAAGEARELAKSAGIPLPVLLADMAAGKAGRSSDAVKLVAGLHVVPEFLGNRAPFADPHARAIIAGLGMERDVDSLVCLYIAGLCGIGYGLRQIIETQAEAGVTVENIVISGGAGQHDFVRQVLADASGKPVVATKAEEPVLLGAAILGAVAGRRFADVREAMSELTRVETRFRPSEGEISDLHRKRYEAFKELQTLARKTKASEDVILYLRDVAQEEQRAAQAQQVADAGSTAARIASYIEIKPRVFGVSIDLKAILSDIAERHRG